MVTALVAAHDEGDRVAATVAALRSIPEVDRVVVVDDGSADGTAEAARLAGAYVLSGRRRRGKGRALEAALSRPDVAPDVWLLADADLGVTAAGLRPLVLRVLEGGADLAVGVLPPQAGGGLGVVRRGAALAIEALCGFATTAPLSGQRAVTAKALGSCRPLAPGFGVETAMTIDAVRAGLRVVEVPVVVMHRSTGRTVRGFTHRAMQGVDILRAVLRRVRPGR